MGPVAVGTRIRQVVAGPMGRSVDADIEITALEPGAAASAEIRRMAARNTS